MTYVAPLPNSRETAAPRSGYRRLLYPALGAALAIGVAISAIPVTHSHAVADIPTQPTPSLTATIAIPRRTIWPVTLEASGSIAAWQEASIGTQIGGYQLIDVRVNVGDQVRKGQVLALFDPALLRADEAQLEANYDQAAANRQRILSLQSSGAVSDQDVLQFVTQARTANALLTSKRLQLRYTAVLAPDDGAISARTATLGAVVPVGQELFRLIRQNRLEWRGELTAAQLALIAVGQKIELSLPDGTLATATVRQTAPALDAQSRLGIAYADIVPGSSARSGMYANGRVVLGNSAALVVPAESVVIRDGRSDVLAVADGGPTPRVSLRPITVGRRQGDEIELVRGVSDSDRLIVQGAGFLNDGDVVRLADQRSALSRKATP